jgi:hypothetical protein
MDLQVDDQPAQNVNVVLCEAENPVAPIAQQLTKLTSCMVVVDYQLLVRTITSSASSTLSKNHGVIILGRNPVLVA